MKANTDKSHLLLSGNSDLKVNVDGNVMGSGDSHVLLGTTIDSNFSLNKQ